MQLQSFRELLLKKSVGNNILSTFIEYMDENRLAEHLIEALEKMARPTNNTGSRVNGPVAMYAANLDRTDVMQLRDALSHHASHYRAALKAHHDAPEKSPEREKFRQIADQHLNHLLPLMHLAALASPHSNGRISLDYTRLPAWESNYTTLDRRPETNKYVHDTRKLRRRPSPGARMWSKETPHHRGVRDYHYLEMPPHPGHPDYANMPHEGGYPWEEVQIGSHSDVDNKQAYLHLEDIPDKTEYTPHPFDYHPIREFQDIQQEHLTPERLEQFEEAFRGWKSSEHHKNWLESQKAAFAKDPEGYKQRGKVKPGHFYEGIPLKEQLEHINDHPRREKKIGGGAGASMPKKSANLLSPETVEAKFQEILANRPDSGVMVRRRGGAGEVKTPEPPAAPKPPAVSTPTNEPHPMEIPYKHYMELSESDPLRNIFHGNAEFMDYLKTKQGGGND